MTKEAKIRFNEVDEQEFMTPKEHALENDYQESYTKPQEISIGTIIGTGIAIFIVAIIIGYWTGTNKVTTEVKNDQIIQTAIKIEKQRQNIIKANKQIDSNNKQIESLSKDNQVQSGNILKAQQELNKFGLDINKK